MLPLHHRALSSALAAGALFALVTGCGGSDTDTGSDTKPSATASAPADPATPAPPARTEAELTQLFVADAETKGFVSQANDVAAVRPEADDDACTPLADMTASGTARTPEAAAWTSRSFSSTAAQGLTVTVNLSSYEDDGAQRTLTDLRAAIDACADGFVTSNNNGGATVTYKSVEPEKAPAEAGEESVSWVMTGVAEGAQIPMHLTAVREGSTLAVFFTLHLTDPAKAELPEGIFAAQTAKLA
ncbi:hypothetical protein [Streptomyces sp. NPDC055749]